MKFTTLLLFLTHTFFPLSSAQTCRNRPDDAGFPPSIAWAGLKAAVSGRLLKAVPTAAFCRTLPGGQCTPEQWASAIFRNTNPGSMVQINWEQDYDSTPPSLCLKDAPVASCGQGNVPLYAVNATSATDIQAAVTFARMYNLRLSVKSSGHDFLGRSTAKNSLLIFTHGLQSISFTENFRVGTKNKGSAVTIGSGVYLNTLYRACAAKGKIVVGGTAASVAAGGGYIQGGGHSALSPLLGLGVDNLLEVKIVVASGALLTANEKENADLFWALRGGGSGSWGVIVTITIQTFPTFNLIWGGTNFQVPSNEQMGQIAAIHAKHIFDLDALHGSQYFYLLKAPTSEGGITNAFTLSSYFPNTTEAEASAALEPFLSEVRALGITVDQQYITSTANEALTAVDDTSQDNVVLGSRFFEDSVYRTKPEAIGTMYTDLLNGGTLAILGHLVAGGRVAQNVNLSAAVHPAWRTAKTHMIVANQWRDSDPIETVKAIQRGFQTQQLPIIEKVIGKGAGSYSNEGDIFEPDFQTTYYGSNYPRLLTVKQKYDPQDLFIVRAGVGSERWDQYGLCKV